MYDISSVLIWCQDAGFDILNLNSNVYMGLGVCVGLQVRSTCVYDICTIFLICGYNVRNIGFDILNLENYI